MEHVESFHDEEWESLNGMFSIEELDFTLQFLGQYSFPHEGLNYETPSRICNVHDETNMNVSRVNEGLFFSQDSYSSGCSSSVFNTNSSPENYYLSDSNPIVVTNDVCLVQNLNFSDVVMDETIGRNEESNGKQANVAISNDNEIQLNTGPLDSKRKCRVSRDVQKGKKNVQPKNKQKLNHDKEESTNVAQDGQSSSNYSSDDEKNNEGASFESKGVEALNSNGKTRAGRGSATDPQSLYARKRRERINERLRILQNLVPNGTKVDISTMLEEAVNYVKFLQLQIKLLSSDDMWMYSPIAYNGMDIGLHKEISPLL